MPKRRMLSEKIILSRKLNSISEGAENLYYRLLVISDDFGRYHANPEIIKGKLYPLRKIGLKIIGNRINELHKVGLVKLYESDGEIYIEIKIFEKHQYFRSDYKRKEDYPVPVTYSNESVRLRTTGQCWTLLYNTNVNAIKNKSAIDKRLTELLIELMFENDPKSYIIKSLTEKRKEDWMNQCRLLRERDERNPEDIEAIIRWSQAHEFWKSNILSMGKLRKQFSRLWLQAKKSNFSGIEDWIRKRRGK